MYVNNDFDVSKSIFRFTTIDRLIDIIISNELTFVRPTLWDDPFENFLFNQKFHHSDGSIENLDNLTNIAFGQCWTFKDESDFAWKVYSPNGNSVRIEVQINELYKCLEDQAMLNRGQIIMGKVQYQTWKQIKEHYENPNNLSITIFLYDIVARQDLFLKRNEFKHEEEFRVIFSDDQDKFKNETIVKFKVDSNSLIKSIMLDPRMSDRDFYNYKYTFEKLGYTGQIKKSELYSIPKLNIKLPLYKKND